MLKRIITIQNIKDQKVIQDISIPIKETNLTKTQLQFNNYILVNAEEISDKDFLLIKNTNDTYCWDEQSRSIVKQVDLISKETD